MYFASNSTAPHLPALTLAMALAACGPAADDSPRPDVSLHRVPADVATIQAALDQAGEGDTILIAPGTWRESIRIPAASVTLASEVILEGDSSLVERTVIDGGGAEWVVRIEEGAGRARFVGLTLRNAEDCIYPHAPFDFEWGIVTGCVDGIDYEAGGGRLAHSRLFGNADDGVDLDGDLVVEVVANAIHDNAEDGIEMRMMPYTGPLKRTLISGNAITGNGQDGIQFIGYAEPSARAVRVEGNTIRSNGKAGIGCMDNEESQQDYRAATLAEEIVLVGNTLEDNDRDLSCGGLEILP